MCFWHGKQERDCVVLFTKYRWIFRFLSTWNLTLVIQTNGTQNFGRFGKKVIPRKVLIFFPENSHRDEPFHLNSPWNFRVFHKNGKRSRTNLNKKANTKWILVVEVKCRHRRNGLLMTGSVSYEPSSTTDIRPFAASHSKPLESNKQRKLPFKIMYVFCLSCLSATFALQRCGFVPREWLAAKGLL